MALTLTSLRTMRAAPWVALAVSGGMLIGAWIFEYGFGYAPCTMCYWQRHVHKAVIITALAILVLHRIYGRPQGWTHWILAALFLGSFGLAAWHVGVEFGIFEGPKTCAGGGAGTMPAIDPNDPLSFLDGDSIKPPACSEAVWHFLGLSMAAWNAVISLIAALWMAISKGTTSDKGKTAP